MILADGSEKEVSIPGKRKKWSQVTRVLDSYAWIRVECLDPKGKVVDIVDNEDAAGEMEELDGYGGQVHQLTALMLKAQDVALRRQAQLMEKTLEMNLRLSQVVMDRLNALEKSYGQNLKLVQKFAAATNDDSDDGLMSSALLEAIAPTLLLKLAPGLVGAPSKPAVVDSPE